MKIKILLAILAVVISVEDGRIRATGELIEKEDEINLLDVNEGEKIDLFDEADGDLTQEEDAPIVSLPEWEAEDEDVSSDHQGEDINLPPSGEEIIEEVEDAHEADYAEENEALLPPTDHNSSGESTPPSVDNPTGGGSHSSSGNNPTGGGSGTSGSNNVPSPPEGGGNPAPSGNPPVSENQIQSLPESQETQQIETSEDVSVFAVDAVSVEDVDEVTDDLEKRMELVVQLEALIDRFESDELTGDDYTEETWLRFSDVLEEAKASLVNAELSIEELEGLIEALQSAFDQLVLVEVVEVENVDEVIYFFGLTGQREFIIFTILGTVILVILGMAQYFKPVYFLRKFKR